MEGPERHKTQDALKKREKDGRSGVEEEGCKLTDERNGENEKKKQDRRGGFRKGQKETEMG